MVGHGHGYYRGSYRTYKGNGKTSKGKNSKVYDYGDKDTSSSVSTGNDDVFDSGMTVMDDVDVIVPEKVRDICISIQNSVGRPEWGALFKGEWTDNGFEVKPEYVIPEQTVSRAHIDYDEDLKKFRDEGYVVNVHSHPFSGRNAGFSGTDDEHINSHFTAALLYAGNAEDIVDGLLNLTVKPGVKVQVDGNVQVEREEDTLPDVDIDSIEKRQRHTSKGTSSKSSGSDKIHENWTWSGLKSSQSEGSEKDDVNVQTTVKLPESKVQGDAEDYEDYDGIEIIEEDPEEAENTGDSGAAD